MLKSLIHFALKLVQGERHGCSFSFIHPDFPATFVEEFFFSPLYVFDTFVKNAVGVLA
jgi:hypothetical protein